MNVLDNDDCVNVIFEVELKYLVSVRVSNFEKSILVSFKSFLVGLLLKICVEFGELIWMFWKMLMRNLVLGVMVWLIILNDDEFVYISGEAFREYTDYVLKNLKMSLWFDVIVFRDEYGIGMCVGMFVIGFKGCGCLWFVKLLCKYLAIDVKVLSGVVEIKCDEFLKLYYKVLEVMCVGFEVVKLR